MPSLTYSGPAYVWNSDIFTKIFQDTGNIRDVSSINVSTPSGFPGESVYFQLHINAPGGGLSAVNVDMSNLVSTFDGTTMSTQTASSPGICRWYVENYVNISTRSVNITTGGSYYNALNNFVPDALVPRIDPYYNQRTNAFPVSIAAGSNQSFLLECDIPAGQKAGIYAYTIKVMNGNSLVASVPGALEVAAGAVPVTPTQPFYTGYDETAMCLQQYGGTTGCRAYNPTVCGASDLNCEILTAHDVTVYGMDHRMSVTNLDQYTSAQGNTFWGHLLNGTASGSFINTIFSGAKLTSVRSGLQDSSAANQTAWINMFNTNSYTKTNLMPYDQACDEPGSNWAACFTTMNGAAASGIPYLVTGNYNDMLVAGASGTVNDLASLINDLGQHNTYAALTTAWVNTASGSTRSAGQYNDCVSGPCSGNGSFASCTNGKFNSVGAAGSGFGTYGSHHIDAIPVGNYLQPLTIWHDTFTYQFNSDVTICWTNGSSCGALGSPQPWSVGGMLYQNFSHLSTTSDGQGDETWIYPGTTAQVAVSTPIVVGSLRLILNTVGEEDVERAKILSTAGLTAYAQDQLAGWYKGNCDWNLNPYLVTSGFTGTVQQMRQNYLCKINQQTYGGSTVCAW